MPVEPHAGVHLHHQCVEFVQRHDFTDEAAEIGDIGAARHVELDAAKTLVGPVAYLHAGHLEAPLTVGKELLQRLQPIEGATLVAACDHHGIFVGVQDVTLRAGVLSGHFQVILVAEFANQGILDRAHTKKFPRGGQLLQMLGLQTQIIAVTQFLPEKARQRGIAIRSHAGKHKGALFVQGKGSAAQLHLLRSGENSWRQEAGKRLGHSGSASRRAPFGVVKTP
jgi:hypothetical protein